MSTTLPALPAGITLGYPPLDRSRSVWEFIRDWDVAVSGIEDFTHEDLLHLMRHPGFDPARDWWVLTEGGSIVGAGLLWSAEVGIRYSTVSMVHPEQRGRGLGTFLLDLTDIRGQELAAESPQEEVLLRTHVDRMDAPGKLLVEARGWGFVRSSYTMMGSLPTGVPAPPLPEGLKIRSSSIDEAPLIHQLIEETFAEHFGFRPVPYEEWAEGNLKRADLDPSLWFIAEMNGEIAGLSVCSIEGETGWIGDIGVRKAYRKRGIGEALLHHSFAVMEGRGCTTAGLGVDAGNETGAVALYERAGLKNVRIYDSYDKVYRSKI